MELCEVVVSYDGAHRLRPRFGEVMILDRAPTPLAVLPAARALWKCSYCLGVRRGDVCAGCGAPASESNSTELLMQTSGILTVAGVLSCNEARALHGLAPLTMDDEWYRK